MVRDLASSEDEERKARKDALMRYSGKDLFGEYWTGETRKQT